MATPITSDDVRVFLRDYPDLNILLDNYQFTDTDIAKALEYMISEWNSIPPITAADERTIPKGILIKGVASWLMRSEAFLQARNQATYGDGEIAPIGIDDKAALYSSIARELQDSFRREAQAFKVAQNMESCYGNLGSGYRWT